MSSTTENLGLTLPDVTDFYDVTNTNMSLIDAAVGQIADTGAKETSVQSIITKIGTTTDTGGTATTGTVMGKLNALQNQFIGTDYEEFLIGRVSNPLTFEETKTYSITGSGVIYGIKIFIYPIHAVNPDRYEIVTASVSIDNENVCTFIVSEPTSISSSPTLTAWICPLNQHSNFAATATSSTRLELYSEPITLNLSSLGTQYYNAILTKPIRFNQNVTLSLLKTHEDLSDYYIERSITCYYLLD